MGASKRLVDGLFAVWALKSARDSGKQKKEVGALKRPINCSLARNHAWALRSA